MGTQQRRHEDESYSNHEVYLARLNRPRLPSCNGRSPRTGKRVGSRHRWQGECCIYCNRFRDDLYAASARLDAHVRAWADARDAEQTAD